MQEEIRNLWLYQAYDVFKQYNTGIKLDYIVLMLVLSLCIVITGIALSSRKNRHYWLSSIPLIVAFSLIEGLRYLRGTDYLNYALLYKYHGENASLEVIYTALQSFFYAINLPYWGIFIVYAFVWIIALLYLFRSNKKFVLYGLPIFILLGLNNFECFIRQNIAFAVIFVFLAFLLEQKYKKAFLCAITTPFIHSSSIVFIFYILIIYWLSIKKEKCIPAFIVIGLYIISIFFLDGKVLGGISEVIKLIPTIDGTVLSSYIENADQWFGADASKDQFARGFATKVGTFIFDTLIVYWSYKKLKAEECKNPNMVFIYNLFSISLILLQLFFLIEIPRRIFGSFYMFASFLIAYIIKSPKSSKKEILSQYIILIYVGIYFLKNVLMASNQLFVWDAQGIYNFYH